MAELTKIGPAHLRREAWVYVRQSTMTQVRENTESLKRQYELVERAHRLGWPADRVRVIDDDLGCSGAEATARVGFQGLVAAVGLGQVGLVLGIEVSRLARRNADWYHLLDLCAMTDTLIADADGLYHPGDYNDRLVLGLKGTMSEAELHVLRSRLDAGLRHKATRGELRQLLPVGLDYDEDGRIVVSPDEAVRAAIVAVFDRFDELGSARQVVLSLRADGLRLPRRSAGARLIRWAEATYPAVHDFLTNPAYGGAFVFGRTKVSRHLDETGRIVTRERELPLEDWEVTIPDHHLGYVSWQAYLANRERLRANARAPRGQGGGAVREGCAMLQGLVVCGKCGRRMLVELLRPEWSGATVCVCAGVAAVRVGAQLPKPERAPPGRRRGPGDVHGVAAGGPGCHRGRAGRGRGPACPAGTRVRASGRAGPLRGRAGPPPVRRGRAGEPPGRPQSGKRLGSTACHAASSRGRPRRAAVPAAGRAHRRRGRLAVRRGR